ncbi:hypothetical protein [uncultured Psychroserpens sp.]|uniref:hypothetical protein n=1 Tax=uncultured Psychroserpens sp. TaxID=255436 RepID=UPI0026353A7E|nr:hypothetical protein [uncultured Psychroserpens sp.]
MRQQFVFKSSKLDDLNNQLIFFFEAIYFQSLTADVAWNDNFIHYKLKPIYDKCTKLRTLLKAVHSNFVLSSSNNKLKVYNAALNSSNIEAICNTTINSLNKKDLSQNVGNAIHDLYKYMYYQLPQTKIFKSIYGELIDHYKALKNATRIKMCPFCGLEPIKPLKSKVKQTYDHYLALSEYPFHGICTKNYVPTCRTCNEDYKHSKDSHYLNPQRTIRRKLFYPYGTYNYQVTLNLLNISLDNTNLKINNCNVSVNCSDSTLQNEVNSWIDIYEINTRYKNIIEDDSDNWYVEFFDFLTLKVNDGTYVSTPLTYNDYLDSLSVQESTNNSFLKKSYFENIRPLTTVFN